ncbi:TPA: DUF1653 domain-containing protein [Candidatus Berkelbacteria bacterium]|uniref:DUF1653 domain-containing protein n=1 Tax=Berkelbacteria bacterium GW2011_GWE1_39_12 TaxID=1618337 RepID=A0A0G4B509_9BACT|nr:MAG: hypothetical protein UT28_C0001G0701 [Berkelbacteria bacterium GW2011_GWE1_39_12]HBO60416.1 DUF1653 domain-containing protein [Candidatus Berkelbacteria bacterium]
MKLGKYKHYKGDLVEVIGKSLHSETLEEFVTYKHISGKRKDEEYFWVRPIKMFKENVIIEGKETPRFEFIEGKQ